ncbi:hypothetical protein P692DRAFT_20846596 [Suillus brevipes Sb2]|nr:hypothetical protein P692DRAFT_20846596 [Suillus brevipes Sb2]
MHRISSTNIESLTVMPHLLPLLASACPLCPQRRLSSVVVSKLSYPSLSASITTSKKRSQVHAFAVKDGSQKLDTVLSWGATWRNRCNPIWRMETDRKRVKKAVLYKMYYQTRLGARTNMEKSFCEGFFLGCVFRLNAV